MIIKRVTSLITLLLLTIGITSIIPGCGDDLDCGFKSSDYFKYINVNSMKAYHASGNTSSYIHLEESDPVNFTEYFGILIYLGGDYYGLREKSTFGYSPFVTSVMACSPISNGWAGSETERLVDIQVTTLNDFDQDHLAGSTINDLLQVHEGADSTLIDDYVFNNKDKLILEGSANYSPAYILHLTKPPALDSNFKVTVVLTLSTNETYSHTAEGILFVS